MAGSPYRRIYDAVARIPRGRVASYGQIARLIGMPRHARQVGYAMAAIPDGLKLPWHRVVNSKGEISRRDHPTSALEQRARLEREGIHFSRGGRIKLARYGWLPRRRALTR